MQTKIKNGTKSPGLGKCVNSEENIGRKLYFFFSPVLDKLMILETRAK